MCTTYGIGYAESILSAWVHENHETNAKIKLFLAGPKTHGELLLESVSKLSTSRTIDTILFSCMVQNTQASQDSLQSSCQTTRMYVNNQSLSWLDEHIGIIKNISWHENDHHTTSLWNLHFKQETGFLPAASWSPSLWQTSAPALIANWLHPHLSDTNTHTYTHLHTYQTYGTWCPTMHVHKHVPDGKKCWTSSNPQECEIPIR